MISETGLRALRVAATMAYAVPTMRVRVRHGERALLDVRRPPFDGAAPGAPMPTCAFRTAVGRAHRLVQAGQHLQFLDLPEGVDPAIDIGLRTGDAALPGGIYRVAMQERWVHLFATTLDPADCAGLAADDEPAALLLGFHWDDTTEVTLVHLDIPMGCPDAADLVEEVLEPMLARCATEELLRDLRVPA